MHRLLLIGCGNMAKYGHCPQLKKLDNLRLVSACDSSQEKAEALKNEFGFERSACDYRKELEKDDIDIVLVATTWRPRYGIIKDALLSGKHVLAEKPLSLYLDEIDDLIKITKSGNAKLRIGYILRASPMMNKIKELIQAETIGTPLAMNVIHHQRGGQPDDFKILRNLLTGGVTPGLDCGIHICDLSRWWFDDEPDSVFSSGCRIERELAGDTLTHSNYTMKEGASIFIEECYSNNTEIFARTQILGDKGTIIPVTSKETNEYIRLWDGTTFKEKNIKFQNCGKPTGEQMQKFIADIEKNADMGKHLDDVRKSTEMALGSLLSEKRREIVKFPLTEKDIREIHSLISRD